MVLWKNFLIALLVAGAFLFLASGARKGAAAKATWAPKETGLLQIPELLDHWNETLAFAIFGLAFLGTAWLIGRTDWGLDVVWNGDTWSRVSTTIEAALAFEVREPGESWKANLIYGCVFGLPFGVPAFLMEGKWTAARAFWAVVGTGFLLWMVQSAAENHSRTLRLSDAGLVERSCFGSRRIPWEEIGSLEFHDVREQLLRLKDFRSRISPSFPHIDIWSVKDRKGQEVLRIIAGMEPAEDFRNMREQILRRIPSR